MAYNGVLVGVCLDLNTASLRVLHQPGPSTTLDTRQRSVELLLESVEAAIVCVDGGRQSARRWLTAALVGRRKVLPEQRVVDVPAAMEVDERLQCNLGLDVLLLLGLLNLLAEVVERGYVGVVVVLVVQLHDLARDVGFERAIIVWTSVLEVDSHSYIILVAVHGRSGSVALPRTNVVPASPAREVTGAAARTAERRADVRRSVVFMVCSIGAGDSIGVLRGVAWCYKVLRLALEHWGSW